MSAFSSAWLVAEREIRHRLRGKSFYLSTAVIVAAVIAGGVISRVGDDGPDDVKVAVAGALPAGFEETLEPVGAELDLEIEIVTHDSADAARRDLEEGTVDAVVLGDKATVLHPGTEDPRLQAVLQQAWAATAVNASLVEAGLTPAQVDAALAAGTLEADTVDIEGDANEGPGFLVGMVAGILLFIALQFYGGFILMGVVEEKATSVIEVLLARVRATHLLAGKVLGIGAVAMLQLVIVVAAGVVSLLISGVDVPGAVWAALPWTALWFTIGFATYAFLFAMAGAMVSRQEDAQTAAIPVTAVLVTGYMAMFVFVGDPSHGLARALAPIPLVAPLLQPARMAAGGAAVLDTGLALILSVATVVGLAKLAGHIYAQLILHRGGRVHWLEAIRPRR
ncbi:MAG: ABC transporter permease [Acidimicrobiia bacterium]